MCAECVCSRCRNHMFASVSRMRRALNSSVRASQIGLLGCKWYEVGAQEGRNRASNQRSKFLCHRIRDDVFCDLSR